MTSPMYPDRERESSLEYLNEYGQLIVDVATIVDAFESRSIRSESETTFSFYDMENEFDIPESITDRIGGVNSANITFTDDGIRSFSLELFGESGSYIASRDEHTTQDTATDTVLADDLNSEDIHKDIQGVPNHELLGMLMQITHPDIKTNLALKRKSIPEDVDLFQSNIYASLIESARTTNIKQMGHLQYNILTTDDTSLTYFFEAGQPESFHLKTIDEVSGRELKVSGVVEPSVQGQASMSLLAPRHAESIGGELSQDLPIDRVYYDAPTLREVKLMRAIIAEEIASLPEPEVITSSIETVQIVTSTPAFEGINQQVDDNITFSKIMFETALESLEEE